MKKTSKLAAIVLALTATFATASGDGWMTDFEAAKKKAATEHKDLLDDFTGSDWCSWCIKLKNEVFEKDAFKNGVKGKFILVEIDYPRDKSKQSAEVQEQNKKLQKTYEIGGYPTVLLMDAKGRPYAKTGYRRGGPEKYVKYLDELIKVRVERDKAFAAADKLSGVAKAKALTAALKTLPEAHLSHYADVIAEIKKLDPADETGFVKEQNLKIAKKALGEKLNHAMRAGKTDEALKAVDTFITDNKLTGKEKVDALSIKLQINVQTAMRSKKLDTVPAMVDKFITDNKVTGEEKQQILGMKMGALINLKKFDEASKTIDDMIAAAPKSRGAKYAEQFKPQLQKMKEAAEGKTKPKESIPAKKLVPAPAKK